MSVPERTVQRYESYLKVVISQANFVSTETVLQLFRYIKKAMVFNMPATSDI